MSNDSQLSRRSFLKSGVTSAAGLAAASSVAFITQPERVFGANDRVRVAVCGVHGRGVSHLEGYSKLENVEVAAVCDVDENVLAQRVAEMVKQGIPKPATFVDVRKLLEDKSIDAISIATPNHWHCLMGIWACQAGQGRVRGEALLTQLVGRPPACAGRAEIQSDGAARNAEPLGALRPGGDSENSRRADR